MSLPKTLPKAVEALEYADRRNHTGVTIHRDLLETLLNGHQLLQLAFDEVRVREADRAQQEFKFSTEIERDRYDAVD